MVPLASLDVEAGEVLPEILAQLEEVEGAITAVVAVLALILVLFQAVADLPMFRDMQGVILLVH